MSTISNIIQDRSAHLERMNGRFLSCAWLVIAETICIIAQSSGRSIDMSILSILTCYCYDSSMEASQEAPGQDI